MREGYYVTRTYQAGVIGEKIKFFVPGTRPTGKPKRRERDAVRKAAQNAHCAVKELARILNANFSSNDKLIGLDYSEEGMRKAIRWGERKGLSVHSPDPEERLNARWECADHELGLCIRRVKDRLKKQGIELKAVYITSDMDGKTGEYVRVHHHLVVNKEAAEAFVDAWKHLGSVDYESMWGSQYDRTPIAEYFIQQVRRIPDAKKYRSTRNLVRPKAKDRIAVSDAELRLPKGAELLFRQQYSKGQPQYIRYVVTKKDDLFMGSG